MTDLESPRKNNDCYFYYYSTCAKGDNCTFRHEPSALGCETMCSFWKEGKCLNVHCNFRHMELRKNRKVIPCYWETQPGGCKKPHCPFLHQNAKTSTADESLENKTDSGTESADNTVNEKMNQMSDKNFKGTSVDALVVNFEEESDNESAPTNSPIKLSHRAVKVKTLEEIKLEKIQAESAAYYSYPNSHQVVSQPPPDADDLRQRILDRLSKSSISKALQPQSKKRPIERDPSSLLGDNPLKFKKQRKDISEIKIKTLEEIRAERARKDKNQEPDSGNGEDKPIGNTGSSTMEVCDSLVTSTCNDEIVQNTAVNTTSPNRLFSETARDPPRKGAKTPPHSEEEPVIDGAKDDGEKDNASDENYLGSEGVKTPDSDSNKMLDEVLLLQDDDDNSNVSLKGEDELLNDSDDLMDD